MNEQNPVPGPVRETFHGEFFRRAESFARDVLTLVPELESVAITPAWESPQDRIPFGLIVGRNGGLSSPQEIVHMAEQLHGTLKTVMDRSLSMLRSIDQKMAEMAEEIHAKQTQLDALNKSLSQEKRSAGGSPGGDPPGSPR